MFRRPGRATPADQPAPEPIWRRQARNILETQIARYPLLVQLRAVWRQLQDEREGWVYLLPLLAVVFVGTYRAERKKLLAQIADLRQR
jgi:hypothetical protein